MSELVQPILIALAVMLIPACARFAVKAIVKKLDEGRTIAEQRHGENVERFDRIEKQTTLTNGSVTDLKERMIKQEAKTELLTEMMLGRQPDKGG